MKERKVTQARYTLTSDSGPYLSALPNDDNGTVAYLYHHESFAQEQIDRADDPKKWTIEPVDDLIAWLESMRERGITHVNGQFTDKHSNTHEINFWMTSLHAWSVGKDST